MSSTARDVKRIIWHHSASGDVTADIVRLWHRRRGWSDIGYHWLIHSDGRIEPGRQEAYIGAHAFGRNRDSIGVCLMGDFSREPPTWRQLSAARVLYRQICQRYGKRLANEFHRAWPFPCPGVMLDRQEFIAMLDGVVL